MPAYKEREDVKQKVMEELNRPDQLFNNYNSANPDAGSENRNKDVSPLFASVPPEAPPERRTSDELIQAMFTAAGGDGISSLNMNMEKSLPEAQGTDSSCESAYTEDEDFSAFSD